MIPEVSSTIGATTDPRDPKSIASKVQAMFMEVMIKAMEDSVGAEDGLFGSSSTSEIYRGMLREQLGATISDKVGGSLKDELEKGMQDSLNKVLTPKVNSQLPDLDELNGMDSLSGSVLGGASKAVHSPLPPVLQPSRSSLPTPQALPVSGVVTSEVGWRKDPFSGAMKYHKGTDIAAATGTSIRAVASGVVVESGPKGEYGNAVVIKTDDGRRMLYGHNSENYVRVGDRVEQGASIAAVGATGRATGPHVHFEVTD
jgi:murein DD-endopeptidase MepM/ murein hydrolase activator NlpD